MKTRLTPPKASTCQSRSPLVSASSSSMPKNFFFWLVLAALFIFILTFFSVNKEAGSDPKLTLLVSQAIIEHGTVRLDAYKQDQIIDFPFQDYVERTKLIVEQNGYYYNFFPAGPSLFSLPFVWIYTLLGKDMRTYDNFELQIILSALSATLVFLLLYQMGTYLVSRRASLVITLVAVAGSSLTSTLGTALWTLNFSTLFITITLLLLVRDVAGKTFNPYILGLLLFLCYFSRPSTAVFILPVLAYLFWQRRRLFWPAASAALVLLMLFLGWSRLEYGQWLPDYYSLSRLQEVRTPMWIAILGNLVSPSRGLFIFSPFFILVVVGIIRFWRALLHQPLFWLCIVWLGLHLVVVARAVIWWGGFSFGPRLLTDALPGMVLLLFLIWQEARHHSSDAQQRAAIALFLFLGTIAMAIHITGLYRPATARWNQSVASFPTTISVPLGDFFDWDHPQFLANNETLCAIESEKAQAYLDIEPGLAPYQIGRRHSVQTDRDVSLPSIIQALQLARAQPSNHALPGDGSAALFIGWDNTFSGSPQRSSACPRAEIVFLLDDKALYQDSYWLTITAGMEGIQPSTIALNDILIGEVIWPAEPTTISLEFPAKLLQPGDFNKISFHFPEVKVAPARLNYYRLEFDDRQFALDLEDLTINRSP